MRYTGESSDDKRPVIRPALHSVHLSDPDANKFTRKIATVLAFQAALRDQVVESVTSPATGPKAGHRQVQHRLTANETTEFLAKYRAGATIRGLAEEFKCGRTTVRKKIKAAGLALPLTPPTEVQIDQMVLLYESGLSMARTGTRVGFTSKTVQKYLRKRVVPLLTPYLRSYSLPLPRNGGDEASRPWSLSGYYRQASPAARRLLNQALFDRVLADHSAD